MRFLIERVLPEAKVWSANRYGASETPHVQLVRAVRQKIASKRFELQLHYCASTLHR